MTISVFRFAVNSIRNAYVRISQYTSDSVAVQLLHDGTVVCAFTGSELLLLAVLAGATANVEGSHHSVSSFDLGDLGANLFNDSHKFVA